jgi:hypothetical protein
MSIWNVILTLCDSKINLRPHRPESSFHMVISRKYHVFRQSDKKNIYSHIIINIIPWLVHVYILESLLKEVKNHINGVIVVCPYCPRFWLRLSGHQQAHVWSWTWWWDGCYIVFVEVVASRGSVPYASHSQMCAPCSCLSTVPST